MVIEEEKARKATLDFSISRAGHSDVWLGGCVRFKRTIERARVFSPEIQL